jgi:hypothetical protein
MASSSFLISSAEGMWRSQVPKSLHQGKRFPYPPLIPEIHTAGYGYIANFPQDNGRKSTAYFAKSRKIRKIMPLIVRMFREIIGYCR